MRVLEYGKEHEKKLLFLPCTAEPEWAFNDMRKEDRTWNVKKPFAVHTD